MAYLHREFRGVGLTTPFALKRWDMTRNLVGSGLWAAGRISATRSNLLYDCDGNDKPFYVDEPRLLITSGRVMIRHKGIPIDPQGYTYAIYANAGVRLLGPYEFEEDMPDLDWASPASTVVALDGQNIVGKADHYFAANLAYQQVLQPGHYRVEAFASAGGAIKDVDGLGELSDFGQDLIHQFFVAIL